MAHGIMIMEHGQKVTYNGTEWTVDRTGVLNSESLICIYNEQGVKKVVPKNKVAS